jgi:hypothetical protein
MQDVQNEEEENEKKEQTKRCNIKRSDDRGNTQNHFVSGFQ